MFLFCSSCQIFKRGPVADRPRSGRPRVTSQCQDRAIDLSQMRDCHLTATKTVLTAAGIKIVPVHSETVRNRLCEASIRARRPYVGTHPKQARRMRCIAWLAAHAPRRLPMRQ